ncbi:hypothetical protein TRICI_005330 [Trichomonascus ciferrii]|uniref:Uncharacterized protein n=1 Tax=Trichomonascus ciferrii TaxID=44093 RepID=A0A642UTV3_9ASCO|nr:hypothetical protein TRICI_005330 [Trichomonascus ciferrii]
MTEASANYGKNSPVRSNALAQRYGGLYLGDRVYGGKQNPDVDPPGFDAGIAGEAETEQNTVTVDYEKVTDIRSAIVDAVRTKSTEDEDIIIAIVNYPISEKENLDAVLESQYVRHPSYVSVKDQKLNYFIVILQSRGHIGLVRAIMFRLKKKLGDRTDYDVEKADEGSLYECTVVSDIGVLSLFKKVYYNKINGAYKSGCSPTVFEIAWMQSTADAKGKVQVLDFTVQKPVWVAIEKSHLFCPVDRLAFYKCLFYKISEQIDITESFVAFLVRMRGRSFDEVFAESDIGVKAVAEELYDSYFPRLADQLQSAELYLAELRGYQDSLWRRLETEQQQCWHNSDVAKVEDFELCFELMSRFVIQGFDVCMSVSSLTNGLSSSFA